MQELNKSSRKHIETTLHQWSDWSECSTECKRMRTRACPKGFDCKGGIRQRRNCSIERESVGLVCWKEKTDFIPPDLKNCKLKHSIPDASQPLQSRIIQGIDKTSHSPKTTVTVSMFISRDVHATFDA